MTAIAIDVQGLGHAFGSVTVLDDLDLQVETGTVVALLGPNGAGKTTLVRILATLLAADRGSARVVGFDVASQAEQVRRSISLTGQYAAVDEKLTGEENLVMIGRLLGMNRAAARERAAALLDRFALGDTAARRVSTLSGGTRRRLDLAVSLIGKAPVVFLDEPTTGLDTRSRQWLWEEIRTLAAEGTTVLLTTQYLEEADQLADRVIVLDRGRIVASGSPAQMKAAVGGGVIEVRSVEDELLREISTDGTAAALRDALDTIADQALGDVRIGIRMPTLDDVFLSVTTTGKDAA
jgi:ABC-2 type transport system ATP-binding protein